jgi:hypothetical protein
LLFIPFKNQALFAKNLNQIGSYFRHSFFIKPNVKILKLDPNRPTKKTGCLYNFRTEWSKIDLTMSSSTGQSSATEIVYFDWFVEGENTSTTGFDDGFDSSLFPGSFDIYTAHVGETDPLYADQNLSIQSLPFDNYDNMVVPIGVNASAGLTITISIQTTNIPADVKIYLEDKDHNSFTLLDADSDFTVYLSSNENNTGRFYLHTTTNSGSNTYNKSIENNRWYIISSPVSDQDIDVFIADEDLAVSSVTTNLVGLANYNNDATQYTTDPTITSGWWEYYQTAQTNSGNFIAGEGKIVRLGATASDQQISFTGTLNSGDITVPLTSNTTAYNLVGNPYATAIAINSMADATNNVLTVNSAVLSEQTAWFWDGSNAAYTQVNQNPSQAAKFTAAVQGFFVKSIPGGGNLSFTTAMQTSSQGSFNRQTEFSKIDLSMSADGQTSATEIVYFEGATTGWDNGYDSTNFSSAAFQLFTDHVDNAWDDNLSIQSLPPNNYDNMVVPVGVYASAGQSIAISIGTTNWPEGVNVYLEDTDDNSFTLLTANTAFTTLLDSDENGIGRFYIHTTSNSLGDEDLTLTDVVIYTPSKDILRILGLSSGPANVQMFDLMGKQVLNTSFNGQSVNDVKLPNLNTGVYLVTLVSDEGTVNKKLMIQ